MQTFAHALRHRETLIIEKSGGGENQPVGRAVLWDGSELVMPTNFAARLRVSSDTDARYATYLLASMWSDGRTRAAIKRTTGIQNLDLSALLDERVSCPPLRVQRVIAEYLDCETAQIDAIIAAKRRMVALLLEKRQRLLSHYVFAGCDPTADRTETAIPWLPRIPSHWRVAKFTRDVFVVEGQVDPRNDPYSSMLLIAPNHIEQGTGIVLDRETASAQGAISGKYVCRPGDVIYSKIRPALRKATIATQACLCSADMYPLRVRADLDPRYLFLLLLSDPFTTWAVLESERVAMPKINRESLADLRIPVPPLEEQRRVVMQVADETSRLDHMRSVTERSITLLLERRQGLITAAVTGQLDIPEAA